MTSSPKSCKPYCNLNRDKKTQSKPFISAPNRYRAYMCSLRAKYTSVADNALRVHYSNSIRYWVLPWYCCALGMFALACLDCFYATMRNRRASLVRRVRGDTNSNLIIISNRLDYRFMNHIHRAISKSTALIECLLFISVLRTYNVKLSE